MLPIKTIHQPRDFSASLQYASAGNPRPMRDPQGETKGQPAKEIRCTEVTDHLEKLPLGTGLLPDERDQSHEKEYAEVFQEVIEEVEHLLGRSRLWAILEHLPANHELTEYIQVSGTDVTLAKNGFCALPLLVDVLTRQHLQAQRAHLKDQVLRSCKNRGVPLPQMEVGVEESGADIDGYWCG